MNLDGITLHCITNELADILKGGQISKIYQLDARSLYFRIFNDTGIHHLVITLDDSPRLYVADTMPPTPDIPTGLCMFLRKFVINISHYLRRSPLTFILIISMIELQNIVTTRFALLLSSIFFYRAATTSS